MILILTDRNDIHADRVIEEIRKYDLSYIRFNLDVDSLKTTIVIFENNYWKVKTENGQFNSKDISCVWCRRTYVELLLEESYDHSPSFRIWKGEWNKTLLGIYVDLANVPWLNPYRNAYSAENKYRQIALAKSLKLKMPVTIVSNDRDELLGFARKHEKVVIKLMHQDFYKTGDEKYKGLYVNIISPDELQDFKTIGENPIVLQKYIKKKFEVRYTVVGEKHFVCKIDSQKSSIANIDWRRYDLPNTPHSIVNPPDDIRVKVNLMMKEFGLEYGALDFIVTPEDDWYFLEINSMGQFLWIEDLTGLKISAGIAYWLKNAYF
ncbi:MAG: hypothetical protein R2824_24045 [Saprospiraceae bacterium]|nr:hypothetical protein [Lewinella sp.]